MSIDYDSLTEQIMDGMKQSESGLNSNIIKTAIGDSVLGRFVIYKTDPKNSIYHYFHHGWKTSGDKYVSYLCPTTNGEKCPICARSIQMWKSDDSFLKDQSKKIRRRENYIANFYIIENASIPSMNGQVKMFRFGKQVKTILDDATEGEDKEIFGKNIWRLDSRGCNFRINVKPNSDAKDAWPSYTSSKFLPPSDLNLSDEDAMDIINSTHDHTKIFDTQLSYEELSLELQKNFIDDLQGQENNDDDFTLNGMKNTSSKPSEEVKVEKVIVKKIIPEENQEIDDLLDQIDEETGKAEVKPDGGSTSEIDDLLAELDD
jgi:hypothetical protein